MIYHLITSLPLAVCLFWSVVLCMDWQRQRRTYKLRLMVFSLVATLLYLGHYAYFNHKYHVMPVTNTIYCMANLAVYPLFYLYLKEITEPRWSRRWYWALAPALLAGITIGTCYVLMSRDEMALFIEKQLYEPHYVGNTPLLRVPFIALQVMKVIFTMQVIAVLASGYKMLKNFDEMVENCYSDTEERNTRTMRGTILAMLIVSVVGFTANIIGRSYFCHSTLTLGITSVLFSSLLFALLYAGHRQEFTIADLVIDNQPETVSQQLVAYATKDTVSQVESALCRLMEEEKAFLKPDLRINDLAQMLGTNREYIYQAIKNISDSSFAEYINRQRIDYAIMLLKDNPSATSAEIYLKSGFTSHASFFRNFKLYKGISPREYVKKNLSESP